MEQLAKDAFTADVKQHIFNDLGIEEKSVKSLGGFESFVFARPAINTILRITHISHRDEFQIQGELAFIKHLCLAGAAVCKPIAFNDGALVRRIDEFVITQFQRAPGDIVTPDNWNDSLFYTWGRHIGEFHKAAQSFKQSEFKRFDWQQDENLDFRKRIPGDQKILLGKADACLAEIGALPKNDDIYGLIHCDAHYKNFFFDEGKLTFFDFDDCCYQWFVFDVATILFGVVLMPEVANTRRAQEAEVHRFLPAFLQGYHSEFPVSSFMLENLSLFLKARELSMYAVIHAHMDVNDIRDSFPRKLMLDRQRRIEAGEPYLDMDFMQFMPNA